MVKKVIGIYCGAPYPREWDETSLNEGLGGSESWAIYLSNEFANRGYKIVIFNTCSENHISKEGVEYINYLQFDSYCENNSFDYFISSRLTEEISENIKCDNIYIIAHDLVIINDDIKEKFVKKYAFLSNSGFEFFSRYNKVPLEKVMFTSNGVDASLYKDVDTYEKKNQAIWSSCPERGLVNFINYTLPYIVKEVPDFKLIVTSYNDDLPKYAINNPNVEVLYKKSSKEELAKLQMESKLWIYEPAMFETFCITAVENGFAKNALLCSDVGALKDTLNGLSTLIKSDAVYYNGNNGHFEIVDFHYRIVAHLLAKQAIKVLKDDKYRKQVADEAYNICKRYTWQAAADTWENEWNSK